MRIASFFRGLAASTCFLVSLAHAQTASPPIPVGANPVAIGINPVTNKVYVANQDSNTVTVIDRAAGTTKTIAVGTAPMHIGINSETNRIYVGNITSANVSVIDGATDAVAVTLATGGAGWTAVNPLTDRAYVLRYGNGDEVNVLQGDAYALTSATRSYTPTALAINPVNNYLYIVHQTTGDIVALDMTSTVPYPRRVCPDGAGGIRPFDEHEANPPACINVPDVPVAVAVNPVTNKIYAISSAASAQVSVISGTNHTFTSLTPPGVGPVAKAIAVNPLTNRIYAAFDASVVVIDGATNAMTVIPSGAAGAGPVAIGINMSANRIYVPNANGTMTVINGADNSTAVLAIAPGARAVAVNPATNTVYVLGTAVTPVAGAAGDPEQPTGIVTTFTALAGNTAGPSGAISLSVANSFTPAPLSSTRKVYYQLDSRDGTWRTATGSGPYTAAFSGLSQGTHTIYAFATNGLDAPNINTQPQHTPLIGNIAAYTFTVSGTAAPAQLGLSSTAVAFGAQSMGTTSPPKVITLTNTGGSSLTVSGLAVSSAQFAQTNNCVSLDPGQSCAVNVTFTPEVAPGALNSSVAVSGSLTISSNTAASPHVVSLDGSGEKSLVVHYYNSILRRPPDAAGKSYWQSEAQRLASLGADPREAVFALASAFFASPEYTGRSDAEFITDLYKTFFNRAPDSGGLQHWSSQIASGMPREVVLLSFMFSPEFRAFAAAIFGSAAARAEVDMVMDFYRGLLGRLPDAAGYNHWVQQLRTAQCQGAGAVYGVVESISASFLSSGEYGARARTYPQMVGDFYNSFLRRGGDLAGVQFWIGELSSGKQGPHQVRRAFISTSEFNNRVSAVIAQGCVQ